MIAEELPRNMLLVFVCYAYILSVIFLSGRLGNLLRLPLQTSRKFLHVMIGNLPFIVPLFTASIYPVMVAVPFVFMTFLVTRYSPIKGIIGKMTGLHDITEGGHQLGLFFYTISYTLLALSFGSKPLVIATGILPMAYGDATASIVGETYGRRRYKLLARKSLEGSAAMFIASFFSLTFGFAFFAFAYSIRVPSNPFVAFAVASVATLAEAISPVGFDNLTVPAFSALVFLLLE